MRLSLLLLALTACEPGKIEIGADTGGSPDDTTPTEYDADGDGHLAAEFGGDDCDDADPTAFPGAEETWYDGVDQDCDGGSDYDADADGADATTGGGPDCDDTNDAVHPGALEDRNLEDEDCDGLVDEDWILAGDIIVTEIMHHPLAASDNDGEWFELTNTSGNAIDLVGWIVSSDDGDTLTISQSLVVDPDGYVVLGASSNTGLNGGITVDYAYDRATMSLSADDSLFLQVAGGTIFDVSWTTAWGDGEGASLSLDPDHLVVTDARQSEYWCESGTALPSGDFGTPGRANSECSSLDEDGDGRSEDAGDCDDTNASVHPGADEVWDGLDNDCSLTVDDAQVDDIGLGYVDGVNASFLPAGSGLGLGDVTGDGTVDLMVGAAMAGGYAGTAWIIDGDDAHSLAGDAFDYDAATITGDTYSFTGSMSGIAGDLTGDGRADVVVGGGGYGTNGAQAVLVFESGGAGLSGSLDSGDARFTIKPEAYSYGPINRVLTSVDTNGDGIDELVYGQPYANAGSQSYCGEVAVFDPTGLSGQVEVGDADATWSGGSSQDYLGVGLGGGDLDGDGYDDLVFGATGADDGASDAGAWYIASGTATFAGDMDVDDADQMIQGDISSGQLGFGSVGIGDFDGNGRTDLAVGGLQTNAVYLYSDIGRLGSELDPGDADLRITGDGPTAFGFAVTAGDMDGDGVDDLLAGAPGVTVAAGGPTYWYNSPGGSTGMIYLYSGAGLGTGEMDASEANSTAEGESSGDLFGAVFSGIADVTGDGIGDVLVGAPRGGTAAAGRVWVVEGN